MASTSNKRVIPWKKLILAGLVVVVIVALASGAYFFNKYQKDQSLLKNPQQAKADEAQILVAKVGKLVKLPDETPAVATVSDISKLSGQSLFKSAQNGDKVLIFAKNKKAVIYRPSTNQVINIGNIVVNPNATSAPASPQARKVSMVIYNGTKTAGYAKTVSSELTRKFPNIEIGTLSNASNDYQKTLVVDLSGNNKSFAQSLAADLGGEVGNLPSGEVKPANADVLIILGK
jgi:hypothetical protein